MKIDANVINAITSFLTLWFDKVGVWQTFLLFGISIAGLIGWKVYNINKKDKETSALVAEKERTIQRLAAENRSNKILIFKKIHGWSDEEIERFFIMNDGFEDGPSARIAMEKQEEPRQIASKRKGNKK